MRALLDRLNDAAEALESKSPAVWANEIAAKDLRGAIDKTTAIIAASQQMLRAEEHDGKFDEAFAAIKQALTDAGLPAGRE